MQKNQKKNIKNLLILSNLYVIDDLYWKQKTKNLVNSRKFIFT